MQKHSVSRALSGVCTLVPLSALAVFCCAYLAASYGKLAVWYRLLGPCLYRDGDWQKLFFTPATKSAGNFFCLAAIGVIALMTAVWIREGKRPITRDDAAEDLKEQRRFGPSTYIAVVIIAVALGARSALRHSPSTDEIFSALYAADAHPFQALSYYMLPNNHVLFNALNSVLVHAVHGDALWTGRAISVAAYAATLVIALRWFERIIPDKASALAATAVLAVQGVLWGFGGQARGYALNGLAHWIAFAALLAYGGDGDRRHLRVYVWASVTGYATLPTYLYFHVGAACWAVARDIRSKQVDWLFWRAQVLGAAGAFLFYVPLFCFSGARALTNNPWSEPSTEPLLQWASRAMYNLADYDNYAFAGPTGWLVDFSTVLLLLPVALLFLRVSTAARRAGTLVLMMWCGALLVFIAMKKDPFHRNLIGLFSISAAVSLVALRVVVASVSERMKNVRWTMPVFVLLCAVLALNFVQWFIREMPGRLYYYDVEAHNRSIEEAVRDIPVGDSVYVSDEAFPAHYVLRRRGVVVTHCLDTSVLPSRYIRYIDEPLLPASTLQHYQLQAERAGMQFYVRVKEAKGK